MAGQPTFAVHISLTVSLKSVYLDLAEGFLNCVNNFNLLGFGYGPSTPSITLHWPALSTSILLDEQLNRRHMTVMRVSGSCRQFLCETVSRLGVATTTHMLKGLHLWAFMKPQQGVECGSWAKDARRPSN